MECTPSTTHPRSAAFERKSTVPKSKFFRHLPRTGNTSCMSRPGQAALGRNLHRVGSPFRFSICSLGSQSRRAAAPPRRRPAILDCPPPPQGNRLRSRRCIFTARFFLLEVADRRRRGSRGSVFCPGGLPKRKIVARAEEKRMGKS